MVSRLETQSGCRYSAKAGCCQQRLNPRNDEVRRVKALGHHLYCGDKQHDTKRDVVCPEDRTVEGQIAKGSSCQARDDGFFQHNGDDDAGAGYKRYEKELEDPIGSIVVEGSRFYAERVAV